MLAGFGSQWEPFFWQGVLLMVLGILAILVPGYATLATEFLLGWLMLGGGAIRLLGAIHARRIPGAPYQSISILLQWKTTCANAPESLPSTICTDH